MMTRRIKKSVRLEKKKMWRYAAQSIELVENKAVALADNEGQWFELFDWCLC